MQSIKKIVVIGPESTGKSTLSSQLADHFGILMIPEFAREYINSLNRPYREDDLLQIAKGQINLENSITCIADSYVICDTDMYVIKVWSEHKYNTCHPWILEQIAMRTYNFYILCDIDMPWIEDPQREHPMPAMRRYFFEVYKDIVVNSGVPFIIVKGNEEERLHNSIRMISNYFKM